MMNDAGVSGEISHGLSSMTCGRKGRYLGLLHTCGCTHVQLERKKDKSQEVKDL